MHWHGSPDADTAHVLLRRAHHHSTFSWRNAGLCWLVYTVHGLFGVTLCYHRLLTHRSFKTSKWFEYLISFIGAQAGQGDPIEW